MIEVTNKLMEVIDSGNIPWLILFLSAGVIWHCVTNIKQIYDFLHARRKQQVERLIEALKCEHLDESFRIFLQQQLNKEYWYYITNIFAENKYRDKLISLHESANDELSFGHFKRAHRHFRFVDGQVRVIVKWYDTFGYYANIVIAILFGFTGFVICLSQAIVRPDSLIQILQVIALGVSFIVVALFSLSQTSAVYSARKIKQLVEIEPV